MPNRCLGYILMTVATILFILCAIILVPAVDMYRKDDRTVSKKRSRFTGQDTETYMYVEFFIIAALLGTVGVVLGCCGIHNLRNVRIAVLERARRRYLEQRPRRILEGAREMRCVYLRRYPQPPAEELEMHM